MLADMGAPVLPGQVSQRASLSHALISGQSVNEYDPEGRAAGEEWPGFAANCGGLSFGRGHRLAHLLDHLLDITGVPQDLL